MMLKAFAFPPYNLRRFLLATLLLPHAATPVAASCSMVSEAGAVVLDVRNQDEWDAGRLQCAALAPNPTLSAAVAESLIGPDILIYMTTFFIKEPRTEAITGWHQDATYFGLRPYEHVSAWIALSPATLESGCMRFVPGSHQAGQLDHRAHTSARILNTGGQELADAVDRERTVAAPLETGEFSLHHTLTVHHSPANESDDRRIGFAVSYIPTRCRHIGESRLAPAMLVRGNDTAGHFDLEPVPRVGREAEAERAHADCYARYRANYNEQVALVEESARRTCRRGDNRCVLESLEPV